MAIKSNLVNIPLKGDINMSKNKYDVIPVGGTGFLKNNGVLYGDVLSPIYRTTTNVVYDFYDKQGRKYQVTTNGLTRQGDGNVMSYSSTGFKTEKLSVTGECLSIYKSGSTVHKLTLTDDALSYDGYSKSLGSSFVQIVLAARLITENRMVIFGKANSVYKVLFYSVSGSTWTQEASFTVSPTNVGQPIINCYKTGSTIIVSVITDSGANVKGDAFNYNASSNMPISLTISSASVTPSTEVLRNDYNLKDIVKYVFAQSVVNNNSVTGLSFPAVKFNSDLIKDGAANKTQFQSIKIHYQLYDTPKTIAQLKTTACNASVSDSIPQYNGLTRTFNPGTDLYTFTGDNFWGGPLWATKQLDKLTPEGGTPLSKIFGSLFGTSPVMSGGDAKAYGFIWFDFGTTSDGALKLKWFPKQNAVASSMVDSDTSFEEYLTDIEGQFFYDNGTEYTKDYISYNTTVTTTYDVDNPCNAILDNGTLICLNTPALAVDGTTTLDYFKQSTYGFTGTVSTISSNTLVYTMNSNQGVMMGQQANKTAAYPYYPESGAMSLGWNYFRSSIITLGADKETRTQLLYDSSLNKTLVNPGYNSTTKTNGKGGVGSSGNWRVLYNNNLISGISYSTDSNSIGTLLTDWNTVSKILFVGTDDLYYLDNNNNVIHLYTYTYTNMPYQVLNGRYIVVNTTSFNNCYDTENDAIMHFASDYNNRFQEGVEVYQNLKANENNTAMLIEAKDSFVEAFVDASAQNANFEMTGSPITSYCLPMEILLNVYAKDLFRVKSDNTKQAIDYYRGISETTAEYFESFLRGTTFKNTALESAVYPMTSPLYNPNIFTQFIQSYNQRDMAINKATATAYPLLKYNGQIIMAYYMTNGLENAEDVFVIQSLHYMVSKGYIYEIYYNGDEISQYQAILPVDGLTYLGCLPTEALFWCQRDRCLYSFTGDAILRKVYQWNEVSTIYNTFYFPDTQELFISTNVGLYCISNDYHYLLDEYISGVSKMFKFDNHFIINATVNSAEKTIDCSYEYLEGADNTVTVQTKYIGAIENKKLQFDAFYIRLYKNRDIQNPIIKVSSSIATDKCFSNDEKNRVLSNLDVTVDGYYVRVQQKYQKGASVSLKIESPYPIVSITAGYVPLDEVAVAPYDGMNM